jgi:hypothetical protein
MKKFRLVHNRAHHQSSSYTMSSHSNVRKRKVEESDMAMSDEIRQGFVGVTMETDAVQTEDSFSGFSAAPINVRALSCRSRRDKDRWEKEMPSLDPFPNLERIDLHQCRYLVTLHESVTRLSHLKELLLVGCTRLASLPESIGSLQSLEVVRSVDIV